MNDSFTPSDLGDDLSFWWDASLPFCVSNAPTSQTGHVECWDYAMGELVDCRLPESVREKICNGEIENMTYRRWKELDK